MNKNFISVTKPKAALRAAVLCAVLTSTAVLQPFSAAAAPTLLEKLRPDKEYGVSFDYEIKESYYETLKIYDQKGYIDAPQGAEVSVLGSAYTKAHKTPEKTDSVKTGSILWDEDNDYIEWTLEAPQDGLYNIGFAYKTANENAADIVRSLTIDGDAPFDESTTLRFYRLWEDKGQPLLNSAGDEVRPGIEQVDRWQQVLLRDSAGLHDQPLKFFLSKGSHTLRFSVVDEPMYVEKIYITPPAQLQSYKDVSAEYKKQGYTPSGEKYFFEAEGENVILKNSSTLRMESDGDPLTTPQKAGQVVMNAIGGTYWQTGNAEITWKFKVPKSGLYQIGFRLKQNYREGLPSYRRIEIDGKVPFRELEAYKFLYDRKWRTEVLSGEDGEFWFYFDADKEHTMSMAVTQGELAEITHIIKSDTLRLSEAVFQITMITGRTPDTNYNYELDKKIPGLIDTFKSITENMKKTMEIMESVSGNKPSKYHQMESMITQLENLIETPFNIPKRMEDINNILSSYGEWIIQMQQHPLILDSITVYSAGEKVENKQSGFFSRFRVSVINFVNSFVKDYDNIFGVSAGDYEVKKTLDIWIGRGKDWGLLLKQMADEDFTAKTGIGVRINILPAGQVSAGSVNALLLAITSGRAPDIGLAVSTESIGEFAMRDAVLDLNTFDGFQEMKKLFKEELFIPMTYNDKIYGIPETMKFTCLFYRKDIFSNLGLGIPNTWDELYDKIIPVLYQNNMQFYMPGNNQAGAESSFNMFLHQRLGAYYTEDKKYSALDSSEAFQAFKEYTEIFTLYGVPVSANFFNRFRTGETPVGIGEYTDYMTLMAAAPEINGKWGIAPVPGVTQKDGRVLRTHTGILGESAMIMSQSDSKEEAFEFLKWWMSTSTQEQFGGEIEAIMGKSARWNTANIEAFNNMAWTRDDLKEIKRTFENVTQNPVVLGGYFTTRHIYNAFNRVVISGENPRDSLEQAVKDINRELKRRRESAAVVR